MARPAGAIVAVKRMKRKYHTWDECAELQEASEPLPGQSCAVPVARRRIQRVQEAAGRATPPDVAARRRQVRSLRKMNHVNIVKLKVRS